MVPREDRDDNENRAHIENQNTPQHFAHCAAQRDLWVFRFTGGDPNQLYALIRRNHNAERRQEAFPAARKEAAVLGQIAKTNRLTAVTKTKENHA
ncbi:hypothetical protein D3C80_1431770 [compost metagenome]